MDYRRVYVDTSVIVDRSRGERLSVSMNITFPQVPCFREWLRRPEHVPGNRQLIRLARTFSLKLGRHGH